MLVLADPPAIMATEPENLPAALRVAANAGASRLSRRESARWIGVDALPFLTSDESGKQFLAAASPRAFARGAPARWCPVSAVATGAPGTTRAAVAGAALRSCFAKLPPTLPDCGCRILAIDDVVTVPQEETAYATGTSARMFSASLGIDLFLVAEELAGGETLLRDLRGPVARLARGENNSVALKFAKTGNRFDGHRIPVGFRRGRIAERIYAADADGNRLSLLIGFDPDELASGVGAWLAWPPER